MNPHFANESRLSKAQVHLNSGQFRHRYSQGLRPMRPMLRLIDPQIEQLGLTGPRIGQLQSWIEPSGSAMEMKIIFIYATFSL
jgi:hypothetical protein